MSTRYDAFVVDLDGTLLGPDGIVSPANRAAVQAVREAGLQIVVATGRALVESQAALDAIDHDGHVIAAGGSLLCDAASGHTLERRVMPQDVVADVARTLQAHGHKALLLKDHHTTGYEYLVVGPGKLDAASEWWFETLPVRVRFVHDVSEDPDPHDTVRAGVVAQGDELARLAAVLFDQMQDRVFLQHWPAVTATHAVGSTTHLLEVFSPDVNKLTMLLHWCAMHHIDHRRVVAIGDGLNDVELVEGVGLGIAMGNASEPVRAAADRITAGYRDDGVAVAIGHVLEGRW